MTNAEKFEKVFGFDINRLFAWDTEKYDAWVDASAGGNWIPCSERLPEENGEYLVTRESKGIYKFVDIVKKTNTSGDIASDIVAWMPLPEPYKGEQNG